MADFTIVPVVALAPPFVFSWIPPVPPCNIVVLAALALPIVIALAPVLLTPVPICMVWVPLVRLPLPIFIVLVPVELPTVRVVVELPPTVILVAVPVPRLSKPAAETSTLGVRTDVSAYKVRQLKLLLPRSRALSALGVSDALIAIVPLRLLSCWLAPPPLVAVPPITRHLLESESYAN